MEDITTAGAGDIVALFGVDCHSGDTFTDGTLDLPMTSIHVPNAVISLTINAPSKYLNNLTKAIQRFSKEDPTFRVHTDPESGQTIISGMGELHLEIYVERMKREYQCECTTGAPKAVPHTHASLLWSVERMLETEAALWADAAAGARRRVAGAHRTRGRWPPRRALARPAVLRRRAPAPRLEERDELADVPQLLRQGVERGEAAGAAREPAAAAL